MPDDAALPTDSTGARAAVLGRLWGAVVREQFAGSPRTEGAVTTVTTRDGRVLRGAAAAAEPFAVTAPDFAVDLDGQAHPDPAALLRALYPDGRNEPEAGRVARFADELDNSVANLALARSRQPRPECSAGADTDTALRRAAASADPLAWLEQSVVDGHPLHPSCRSRIGLSPDEVIAYAPEHRPVVDLVEVAVPESRWASDAPPRLLLHPWQADRLLPRHTWLRRTGVRAARPLMSLRTLALVDDPATHIKTAINVQMTSAVRTVSPAAVHNGPLLTALLTEVCARTSGLTVIPEVAAGAVIVDGEPQRSLAMVRRRLPALPPGTIAMPFAALAAPSPVSGAPIAVEVAGADPLGFVRAVAAVTLPPLLAALRYGIALEAHGQNLLLVLRDARPCGLLYRDLGGVRVSPARLRHHGLPTPELLGDLVTDDPQQLRTKLFAAAVSTVLAELIATLGRATSPSTAAGRARATTARTATTAAERAPAEWTAAEWTAAEWTAAAWREVAEVVHGQAKAAYDGSGGADPADVASLLRDPLPLKAMTTMRLAADPLEDRWVAMPNPLAAA